MKNYLVIGSQRAILTSTLNSTAAAAAANSALEKRVVEKK